mmetsp:Transcript_22282/g.63179  ORF Transcript_22282/g.63179 Transcript_22282/m.63179 type:complete len:211 (-) Transcript_22282:279-911(-)
MMALMTTAVVMMLLLGVKMTTAKTIMTTMIGARINKKAEMRKLHQTRTQELVKYPRTTILEILRPRWKAKATMLLMLLLILRKMISQEQPTRIVLTITMTPSTSMTENERRKRRRRRNIDGAAAIISVAAAASTADGIDEGSTSIINRHPLVEGRRRSIARRNTADGIAAHPKNSSNNTKIKISKNYRKHHCSKKKRLQHHIPIFPHHRH